MAAQVQVNLQLHQQASRVLLQLSLADGVGDGTLNYLCTHLPVEKLAGLANWQRSDFLEIGLSEKRAQLLLNALRDSSAFEQELKRIEQAGAFWCSILDPIYPGVLRSIASPPVILYWQGRLPTDWELALAVVGSRQADSYAEKVINELVPKFVELGYMIVSGGAMGADAMAHVATLRAGGTTIVVSGAGLLHPYPRTNCRIFDRILEHNGVILSSFAMNTAPAAGFFPLRNRIISGLSRACLVVQAAAKSGAKITAIHALEQGREVFVVPGLFGHHLSEGCHQLAQQGAKLIHSIDDILVELPGYTDQAQATKTVPQAETVEQKIVELCRQPKTMSEIQLVLPNLSLSDLQQILFEMQMQQILTQNFAGLWAQV